MRAAMTDPLAEAKKVADAAIRARPGATKADRAAWYEFVLRKLGDPETVTALLDAVQAADRAISTPTPRHTAVAKGLIQSVEALLSSKGGPG